MSHFKPLDWDAKLPVLTKEEIERMNQFLSSTLMKANAPKPLSASDRAATITTSDHTTIATMPVNPYYEIPAISGITTPPQCGLLRDALLWSTATFESTPSGGIRFSRGGNSNPVWSLSDLWEIVHSFTDVEFDTGLTVDEVIESLVRTILANLDKLPSEFKEDYPF